MKTTTEITIRNYHIDHFGHVNHARYVELLEEARWRYLEENKLLNPIHQIEAFHVVAEIVIKYLNEARIGDLLTPIKHMYCKNQRIFSIGLANHLILLMPKFIIARHARKTWCGKYLIKLI
jgi:YbgC/YbaW family acyl-CoA thioester hydrolase